MVLNGTYMFTWFEKFSDSGMNLIHFVYVHCFSRHDVNTYNGTGNLTARVR